ncbi:hypothetical protein RDI58_000873 [Solanum bulbocastanum]
MNGLSKT